MVIFKASPGVNLDIYHNQKLGIEDKVYIIKAKGGSCWKTNGFGPFDQANSKIFIYT